MKTLLLITALILSSCSSPVTPDISAQISAKLNGTPLELCGWANRDGNQLEIFTYDTVENIRTIIDNCTVGLHKAFIQYQTGCMVYTASRADVLITSTDDGLLSCGISFLVVINEERTEGIVNINNLIIR